MKNYAMSSENEMILLFLQSELSSGRFVQKLTDVVSELSADISVIVSGNTRDEGENSLRRKIMGVYRGWGCGREMFENFPRIEKWLSAVCEKEDMAKIRYINYDYWNELSQNTSSPLAAAESVKKDKIVFGVSNENFLKGAGYLKSGKKFPPVILITDESEVSYIILEGHSRMTVYALAHEYFEGTRCLIGYCGSEEIKKWNG